VIPRLLGTAIPEVSSVPSDDDISLGIPSNSILIAVALDVVLGLICPHEVSTILRANVVPAIAVHIISSVCPPADDRVSTVVVNTAVNSVRNPTGNETGKYPERDQT
jgi:hypothetical protein